VKVIDRLFVVAYGAEAPSDRDWARYLDQVESHGVESTMQLVATEGGEPTARQRRELAEVVQGRWVPVVVLSNNRRIRATVTALSWFNRRIKAFPPADLRDAIDYLEIPRSRFDLIAGELAVLRLEVGLPEVRAA